jgi:hypothetical protein
MDSATVRKLVTDTALLEAIRKNKSKTVGLHLIHADGQGGVKVKNLDFEGKIRKGSTP